MILSNRTVLADMTHHERVEFLTDMAHDLLMLGVKAKTSEQSQALMALTKDLNKARDTYKATILSVMFKATEEEKALMLGSLNSRITGIKAYRTRTNCSFGDAKWMCDSIRGM